MVDTPRDGKAWADLVNKPKPWAACSVRATSDPVGRLRFVRQTPAMACRRAQTLAQTLGAVVTIYQAAGGGSVQEAVATVSQGGVWTFLGRWTDPQGAFRREAAKTDALPWVGAVAGL
jgi:hypothetical protein